MKADLALSIVGVDSVFWALLICQELRTGGMSECRLVHEANQIVIYN